MPLVFSPSLRAARDAGQPVVALESAVITHGLPPEAVGEAVRRQFGACREAGAEPAVVAIVRGNLCVGLSETECLELAHAGAVKVSPWNLAATLEGGGFGGTTVAATLIAAALGDIAVASTGGIGGVHEGPTGDVSADLTELGRRRVCVVCGGAKSIVDAAATLERLETLGVPVIGWRSAILAGFLSESAGLPLPGRVVALDALVRLVRRHWELGGFGIVVSQALPRETAIPGAELAAALTGLDDSQPGSGRTPAQLAALRSRLGPPAVRANLALLERNARLAARLARGLAG